MKGRTSNLSCSWAFDNSSGGLAHRVRYVDNSPSNYNDPSGLTVPSVCGKRDLCEGAKAQKIMSCGAKDGGAGQGPERDCREQNFSWRIASGSSHASRCKEALRRMELGAECVRARINVSHICYGSIDAEHKGALLYEMQNRVIPCHEVAEYSCNKTRRNGKRDPVHVLYPQLLPHIRPDDVYFPRLEPGRSVLNPTPPNLRAVTPPEPPSASERAVVAIGVVLYWLLSEGSRVAFPPRNFVPVP